MPFPFRSPNQRSWPSHFLHQMRSPYYRYHNARYLHAVRVGIAMLASIALTTLLGFPHGFWASVTLLVVIGGLQHHGNIRRKAAERGLATAIGAGLGLLLIAQHSLIGSTTLTYLLVSLLSAVCAYYAVGKGGYIALLTAITLIIVAGHGDNSIDVGLWRAFNVAIGTVVALVFSFGFPLYATYDWRFRLADNLRECARLYPRIMVGEPMTAAEQVENFARISGRLVALRSLIAPVAREMGVPIQRLEEVQRLHRSILSALEILAFTAAQRHDTAGWGDTERRLTQSGSTIRYRLLAMSRGLRSGDMARMRSRYARTARDGDADPQSHLHYELQGSYWLAQRLAEQVDAMSRILATLRLK